MITQHFISFHYGPFCFVSKQIGGVLGKRQIKVVTMTLDSTCRNSWLLSLLLRNIAPRSSPSSSLSLSDGT